MNICTNCKYYKDGDCLAEYYVQYGYEITHYDKCRDIKDCYFKQLLKLAQNMKGTLKIMADKKEIKKNPYPLVVKGVFYVTADYDDKQYVVSNGLSFIRFKNSDDGITKGDYVKIHGPVYQKKEARSAIITGEAIVEKLTEDEVEEYRSKISATVKSNSEAKAASEKKSVSKSKKLSSKKDDEAQSFPWD